MNNIPTVAISLVIEALDLAPPSPTVLTIAHGGSIATILRQCGTIAGIASERARAERFRPEWAGVEAVTLLACFAIERHIDGDNECAIRMLAMAQERLAATRRATYQEAVALRGKVAT